MAVVSMRYAEALLELDDDKNKLADNLKIISDLYASDLNFKEIFNNPRISNLDKIEIVREIVSDETVVRFVNLLLEKKRFNLICDIYNKFQVKIDELNQKIHVKIVSSCELTDDEIDKVVGKYKVMYNAKEVTYEFEVDASLIGGIKVIVLDRVYDGTIKTKLEDML